MFMQRDFGTSLVFIVMLGALFIISGVHWKILTVVIGLIAALGAIYCCSCLRNGAIVSCFDFISRSIN